MAMGERLVMERGTERSQELFTQLSGVMPGANTRTATWFEPYPIGIDRGDGPYVWDLDGNKLIDLLNNYTSLVHGHAHPAITEAIVREARRGTVFPSPIRSQLALAERICDRVASVDQVRFTNSGTEAAMHGVRCARAATGRSAIVKAVMGYHGSWDGTPPTPSDSRGIPPGTLETIHWIDYNDPAALRATMAEHGDQVAAILLEPMLGAAVIPADHEFIQTARSEADRYGALLILDEVVTLRLEHAGYQSRLDVSPDLTLFGKVIGGGLPVGAFGGRDELMALYDPRDENGISHHGTFNGNALTMAAGAASLDLLTREEIDRINGLGARLAAGLRKIIAGNDLDAEVTEDGSLVQIHFEVERRPHTGSDVQPDSPMLARFHREALAAGVYVAPRGELNVTTATGEQLIDEALERLDVAAGRCSPAVGG